MYNIIILLISILFASETFALSKMDYIETQFFDTEAKTHAIEEFEDQLVIIHFWATWCSVCITELPQIDRFAKEFKKSPIKIIALSEDFKDRKQVEEFFNNTAQIKHYSLYFDDKRKLFSIFEIIGLPTTIVLDKQFNLVARYNNKIDWESEAFKQEIINLLK